MKCRNIMIAVLVGAGTFSYGNPSFEDRFPNLGDFVTPAVEKISTFFQSLPPVKQGLGSTFTTQERENVRSAVSSFFPAVKETLKKESPSIASNMIHKTEQGRVYVPSQNAFGMDINLDGDAGVGLFGFETLKIWLKEKFSSKPVAAVEQEKKLLIDQIKENPGTTAAIAAGSIVALYGSYKLIQYFDHKKAKKIELAKRLKRRDVQPIVFEPKKKKISN